MTEISERPGDTPVRMGRRTILGGLAASGTLVAVSRLTGASAAATLQRILGVTPAGGGSVAGSFTATFDVVPDAGPTAPLRLPCPRLCPDGTENCWPTLQVRELQVTIAGQARSDPAVAHQVTTRVRLRNDALAFNGGAGAGVCP